ncbi:MAG: SMP-30/gluconolactonase/LRE family protein [Verrucomicrobiaceae bacterium]|nr:SMP-30/gluconolactonase/LRE family protein [Verrucomicrobiaceae bacterium]
MNKLTFVAFLSLAAVSAAQDDFPLTADSKPQAGVPKGEIIKGVYEAGEGGVFPGTSREYQIYLPAGHDKQHAAPMMLFQDGVIYQAPTVFDNLIAKKEIPPLVGIFVRPGVVPPADENALPRFNRSFEYDSITDRYAGFIIDEFLPVIVARHGLKLSTDPNARAIAGSSSGGICAFMVAWHRPDVFRRVFTSVGTYIGLHGADQLPVLVRKQEPKALRVYLQSGEQDNNFYCGDWWMANQTMERSLTWNGYEVAHTWGTGGHNQKHASAIFPDVLRWLWKGYPDQPVRANPDKTAKWRGYEVIGEGMWEETAAVPTVFASALRNKRKDGKVAKGQSSIWLPDQTQFVSVKPNERWGMISQVNANGDVAHTQPYLDLQADFDGEFHAGGMCVDTNGWLYVATSLGVQVLDQCGRVNFIIACPAEPTDVCFGGSAMNELFISDGHRIWKRSTKAKGYLSATMTPLKPPAPKL